jgi:hypothetical protein
MGKKNLPIRALIIDDNKGYNDSLKLAAREEKIIIESTENLEDGIEKLRNNKHLQFVILDGKCFVDADAQATGSTVSNMPVRALQDIQDINRDQNREIHYCVNTGFVDDLGANFEGVFKVFDKSDSKILCDFIKESVENTKLYQLKKKYKETFEVFNGKVLDEKYTHCLIDVLSNLEGSDYRKKNFNSIRDCLEAIYLALINIHNFLPTSFLKSFGDPNLEHCTRYLEGRDTTDSNGVNHKCSSPPSRSIQVTFRKLKETTSELSHLSENDMDKSLYLSNTYCLLEILEWMKKEFG